MKLSTFSGGLVLAAAMSLLPTQANADTVLLGGGLLPTNYTTVISGANAMTSNAFTATVEANAYASGASYSYYSGFFTSGSLQAGDIIYAYVVTDQVEVPANGYISHFSVASGTKIDAVGYVSTGAGVMPSGASIVNIGSPVIASSAQFDFFVPPLSIDPYNPTSTVLLFASKGVPALAPGTLADGASGSSLVLSDAGPLLITTPLPLPTTACAGMGMLGLMSIAASSQIQQRLKLSQTG